MRIGLISQSCDNKTGIGRIVSSLAAEFVGLGHEVFCAAQFFEGTKANFSKRHIPRFSSSKGLNKILLDLSGPPFSKSEVDITHSYGVGKSAQVVSAQSCHRAGMELLGRYRAGFLERHNFGVYDRVSLYDERRLLTSLSTRKIIAASRLVKSQIENFYAVRQEHIAVVPNGVDLPLFERLRKQVNRPEIRSSVGCSQDDFLLLFVGNEFGRKGLRVVLQSLRALDDRRVRLLVVGRGDLERYSRFAVDLGVADKVLFMGSVPEPEALYAAADAFVLPSLYEPFGIVVLEAMAAGVPVVTSKMCGATEGMNHGEQVLHLKDPTSVGELTETLRVLKRDEQLLRKLSGEGRKAVREFAWNSIAQKVLNVYHEVKESR